MPNIQYVAVGLPLYIYRLVICTVERSTLKQGLLETPDDLEAKQDNFQTFKNVVGLAVCVLLPPVISLCVFCCEPAGGLNGKDPINLTGCIGEGGGGKFPEI